MPDPDAQALAVFEASEEAIKALRDIRDLAEYMITPSGGDILPHANTIASLKTKVGGPLKTTWETKRDAVDAAMTT